MPGRTRRTRIVVLLLVGVVAFVIWNRNTQPVDDYRQYFKNKAEKVVGGGSVIRPKLEDPKIEQSGSPAVVGPELQRPARPAPVELDSTITPVVVVPTPSTTAAQIAKQSTLQPAAADPTPAPQPVVQDPQEDDLPYQVGEGRVEIPVVPVPGNEAIHWSKQPEHFPVSSTIQLPSGTSIPMPRVQRAVKKLAANGVEKERLAMVKAATEHAWKGYREFAWMADEVRPVSGRLNNPFNGWGATLVDSLDTLWMMGMIKEFEEAVEAVKLIDFTTSARPDIPIFETTIRYLGGLIAAFDVSGKKYMSLLHKAVELAEVLFGIFDTPNRMPQTYYRWKPSFSSQPHRAGNRIVLAEIGTLSLEFTRLAQLTGESKYYDAVARITDAFEEWQNNTRLPGMWPTSLDASGCGKASTETKAGPVLVPDGASGKNYMTAGEPVKAGEKQDKIKDSSSQKLDSDAARDSAEVLGSSKRKRSPPVVPVESQQKATTTSSSDICVPQGLRSTSKNSQETFTLSGASDSMYEYLPKEYILLGGQVDQYRTVYLASADTFIEKLIYKPMTIDERDILMTGEVKINPNYSEPIEDRGYVETFKPEAAHLACFAGGMFAMGGALFDKPEHIEIGAKLTDGCVWAYNVTATGVMPEGAELMRCKDTWDDCPWNETAYWEVLDPYRDSRTKVQEPITQQTQIARGPQAGQMAPAAPTQAAEVETQAKANLNKRDMLDPSAAESAPETAKRQLKEAALDEVNSPPRPAPQELPHNDAAGTSTTIAAPAYTPEPPPTHEQFVKKKIEEERLPPGYTRISFRKYILRPEAIESVFYMYRITGDQYWRDVGWNMFTSINDYTRAEHGNSAIDDMTKSAPEMVDQMESFWIAETLKYFYLLYDDPATWSLDDWVLNTEAHFFRRPTYEFTD